MSAKTIDVLILIPIIPAIPVFASWYLPWERWIPRWIPKTVIGPYLLYCAFVAWHFDATKWLVAFAGIGGSAVFAAGVWDVFKARRLKEARDWPIVEGAITHFDQRRDTDGLLCVTVGYTYSVRGERYGNSKSLVFKRDRDAARFENDFKERTAVVHYRPDRPEVSVLDAELPR